MKKRIYCLFLLELVLVLLLTITWEFWLEDLIVSDMTFGHRPENIAERLEYVVTSFVFVLISLSLPLYLIMKLVVALEDSRDKLQESLVNIKTLQGLLPICADCKKIRDDDGYWQQLEIYIGKHSAATFSHSICPDCMQKLYP